MVNIIILNNLQEERLPAYEETESDDSCIDSEYDESNHYSAPPFSPSSTCSELMRKNPPASPVTYATSNLLE